MKRTFCVKRVDDGRGRDSTMDVQVVVACCAFVVGTYADFLASITFEWNFGVAWFESVLGVAEMANFIVFHDWICVGFCG